MIFTLSKSGDNEELMPPAAHLFVKGYCIPVVGPKTFDKWSIFFNKKEITQWQ